MPLNENWLGTSSHLSLSPTSKAICSKLALLKLADEVLTLMALSLTLPKVSSCDGKSRHIAYREPVKARNIKREIIGIAEFAFCGEFTTWLG